MSKNPKRVFLFFAVSLLGNPALGNSQSMESMQVRIDHLKYCTSLKAKYIDLSKGEQAISEMIDAKRGFLVIRSEDLKSEMQRRVEALERQNSIQDLDALEKKQLGDILEVLRKILGGCSDTDNLKDWEPMQLVEIGVTLLKLRQPEDAIPVLRRCASVDPDFAGCFEKLGEANRVLGKRDEARASFKKAISIGGFDEFNAIFIDTAKLQLEEMGREDVNRNDVIERKEIEPATHTFGTGFFVSNDGEILTNNHVVGACHNLTVQGGLPVQVVSRDPASDLALVKANLKPDQIAVFRGGPAPRIGDTIVIFGFPLPGILSSEGNVSTGLLSATTGLQNDIRFVQISAPVQPGNSGGPVFDASGHVIGVVVAKLDALRVAQFTGDVPQNVNFAVHWSNVRALLDEQGVRYKKLPSLQAIGTRAIAKIGAGISVTLDCAQ